jgi:2-keto-4-pentenoate hydratase/2-oxohepta-3-ene-1,7-dioic acid hydratase in catechol pathway
MDKIVCLGKNYADHVREMQRLAGDAPPERPVLFLKPPSALASAPHALRFPEGRGEVHPECEIVFRLGPDGRISDATLGLDVTLREVQSAVKKAGHPWEIAKVFRDSAVVGPWIPVGSSESRLRELLAAEFRFSVEGKVRQRGKGEQMSLGPLEALDYAGSFFELLPGDLIFTGTPAGVAPVLLGQAARLEWDAGIAFDVRWR